MRLTPSTSLFLLYNLSEHYQIKPLSFDNLILIKHIDFFLPFKFMTSEEKFMTKRFFID